MKIHIAGDFCPRYRGVNECEQNNFEKSFGQIATQLQEADYRIVNLECPVCSSDKSAILKMGPNLRCDEKSVKQIMKYLGFDCFTLANNHIMDYGRQGLLETIEFCKRERFDYVGVGVTEKEAANILYKKINGKTLAIINCCEFEFSIALDNESGANHLNIVHQYNSIKEAKAKADYVILIIHGGHEHWQLPSPRMVETYRFFIDAGADSIINHHQHCYSGYEVYKGKPIFYGIGNFFFDISPVKTNDLWNYGYVVELNLEESISFNIIPYRQCSFNPIIEVLEKDCFSDKITELNNIILDRNKLSLYTNDYYKTCCRESAIALEPIQNRYVNGLQYRRILPLFRTTKGLRMLYNFILCEAHRDKLQYFLTHKISNQN